MKNFLGTACCLCAFLAHTEARAEETLFSANTPSGLEVGETLAALNHGFGAKIITNGKVEEKLAEQGLGFRLANAGVSVRSRVWQGLEIRAHSASRPAEYAAGASYTWGNKGALVLVGAEGFAILDSAIFRKSVYTYAAASTLAFSNYFLVPSLGIGFDAYNNLAATTLGVSLPFSEEHALVAEYHARINPESRNPDLGNVNSWNAGYRWTSGGHQFAILVSNTSAIHERAANLGSANNDINMAFRITRSF